MAQGKKKNLISDSLIIAEVFIKLPGGKVWENKKPSRFFFHGNQAIIIYTYLPMTGVQQVK